MAFLIVIILLLLIAVGVQVARGGAQRSTAKALAAWAASNGWSLQGGDAWAEWRDRVPGLPGFAVRRMASGTVDGFPVTIADAMYMTSRSGEGRRVIHDLVILCVRLPGPGPETRVEARGAISNVLRTVGLKHQLSIEIGDADFDRRFAIVTDDPEWAAQIFSPGLIEAISADDVRSWTLHGDELLMVKKERFRVGARRPLPAAQKSRRMPQQPPGLARLALFARRNARR
ncbi:hypothetical protein [Actinoallomurus sp. NPDC052274]|uniref:hypothetical protein n=1 Tax=Actinoallomurus sp. NPDC052274 TaxID=3155420 RepID=UPI0034341901